MIHHPVILIPKLIVLAVIIAALIVLHGVLNAAQFRLALVIAAATFVCCTVVIWIVGLRALSNPDSRLAKATTLSHEARAEDGFTASSDQFQALVGARGTAVSALRPSGTVVVEGRRVSVQTNGEFIAAGAAIEVVSAEGSRVVVQEVSGEEA